MVRVAVVGAGYSGFNANSPDLSWKEITYEAAVRAYEDAGINPRRDIDAVVTCAEDFWEGFAIFDEFCPDQLGGVLKPTFTVTADFLFGLANGVMLIKSGLAEIAVVEAHSKASDILTFGNVVKFAYDPVWLRPVGRGHPFYLAALEKSYYSNLRGYCDYTYAEVVAKNRKNGRLNPDAPYSADLTADDVLSSEPLFYPLRKLEIAERSDGAVVFVLAKGDIARELNPEPVWIDGVGWNSETSNYDTMSFTAVYAMKAAEMAYDMAGIENPAKEIDVAEVDDRFAYKEVQHIEALKLAKAGEVDELLESGYFGRKGEIPVNVSGGSLSVGNLLEATGAQKALEIVFQLRGEAGRRQVDAEIGVAQVWRYLPTATGAVAVFSR